MTAKPAPDPRAVFAEAARLHRAGKLTAARRRLEGLLARHPQAHDARQLLAVVLLQAGATEAGIAELRAVLRARPDQPVALYNLANALKQAGRFDEALPLYRQAVARKPDLAPAWGNLGNLLIELGQPAAAAEAYARRLHLRRGEKAGGAATPLETSAGKLIHDAEQFAHLADNGVSAERYRQLASLYRTVAERLPKPRSTRPLVTVPAPDADRLGPTLGRLLHWPQPGRQPAGALNGGLDWAAVERAYLARPPGIVHVDGFLRPQALDALRAFCLEATIWNAARYENGYLGAFMDDGFNCPLLLQVAEELKAALPRVIGDHTLRKMWGFKYDSALSGIGMHADFAAVNVNFWITPDAANRDPDSGGLVVWDKEAPADWDFTTYNTDEAAMRRFIAESGARPVTIPHRQNRCVIFNSDLFHQTDTIRFADGYANRRVNITFLYGKRAAAVPAAASA